LLHNFSLVHDDIEDGSTMRRHRPTAWNLWGVPLTINMGDGLYALAHLALFTSQLRRIAPDRFADLVYRFELAAMHLCEGQHLDMTYERRAAVSVEEYLRMIERKTATLIAAAAGLGAQAAGAGERRTNAAEQFGRSLGMAFQMQDDLLDIWGDPRRTGKPYAADLLQRKMSLPVVHAYAHANAADRSTIERIYRQELVTEAGVQALLSILDAAGSRTHVTALATREHDRAIAALSTIRPVDAGALDALRTLAESLLNRAW
jgi:geranylgeranyl diphosphate synthase type I